MGLDLSNLQDWKDGAAVVIAAPHIVVPLLVAVGTGVWLFRGKIEKDKLEVQEARLKLKDDQIKLKEDQFKILQDKLSECEARQPQPAHKPGKPEPEWKIFMTGANIFQADAPFEGKTGIFLYASVLNTGTSSMIAEWTLSVLPQQGLPVVLRPRAIADRVRLSGDAAIISGADSLIEKVKNKPIALQPVEGWLLFITDLSKDSVVHKRTRFELAAIDIYGNEAKVSRLIEEF
jgi:hypothetical protein